MGTFETDYDIGDTVYVKRVQIKVNYITCPDCDDLMTDCRRCAGTKKIRESKIDYEHEPARIHEISFRASRQGVFAKYTVKTLAKDDKCVVTTKELKPYFIRKGEI